MPLIKVTSNYDQNLTKLISSSDFETLKAKAEEKFVYKISKFQRKEDRLDIEDNDTLKEMTNNIKELWLIAVPLVKKIKVSTFNFETTKLIQAENLVSFKENAEKEFKIKISKIVRECDGVEIDENEIFTELIACNEDLWLLALKKDENFEKEIENESSLDDFDELESKMKALRSDNKFRSSCAQGSEIKTIEIEEKKKKIEQKIKNEEERKHAKKIQLEELNKMSATLEKEKFEREELERKYREKLFTNQVTREASRTELIKAESKLIELDLKKKRIANIFFELRQAEKVDICFMLDCTGSMSPYIVEAKTVIHRIVDKLKKRFVDFELRAAFVGYRDHSDGKDRVSVYPFGESIDNFKSFVTSINATGGADECEDIFGGLEEVSKLSWLNMSRVLFHIGDAPCHGVQFHSDANDSYKEGDPRGLKIKDLLKALVDKNISYYFAEINKSTVKMIDEFNKELLKLNANQINVLNLVSADALTELVTKSIVTTITESKSMSMHSAHGKTIKDIKIDPYSLKCLPEKMKKYKADLFIAKYNGEISDLSAKSFEFEKISTEIYLAENPFAKGSLRFASIGFLDGHIKSVLKQSVFSDPEYNAFKSHKDLIENQVIAAFLAKEFNLNILKTEKPVKFVDVNLIYIKDLDLYFSIEEFISGHFEKWMNNAGVINEDIYSCTLDAFSHWTYEVTNEYLLVTDLQGMLVENKEYILTDPAITSPEGHDRFSSTNLGIKGIQKFFESHKCNHICRYLKLKKHKYQKFSDREYTPLMTRLI